DNYVIVAPMPNGLVYRSVCDSVWFHIDGASGTILERLDPSRRAYRWFYSALHTMDFPILSARPTLRSALIVTLCGFGFVFSLTGVVIGWRRLRLQFSL
ncbi:MAG: PepSY domain-containing protein, partial [Tardiphaga sp.]